ncbi:hypothetical protein IVB03_03540 [Bradyrhizobium sp. 168]|uniref:hypothetical protein n=1 Tax=Bradyrhizobium sp. 168 TaxID=2782639 RepID=UPI001FFA9E88|nr:hypothetical protein [Bradyrhizobium sp. 168]MCK1578680.1 hypothetical protein [Bradyrhizobium sp. 168]
MRSAASRMICLVLLLAAVWSTQAKAQSRSQDSLIADYHAALDKHFLKLKNSAIPLYMSSYRLGDVWDAPMSRLLEDGARCFGSLTIRSDADTIPDFVFKEEASVGLMLRLKAIFDITASGTDAAIVTVRFEDVTQESVSEGDLRRNFSQAACPFLEPVVAGKPLDLNSELPVVVGRLYRGKRKITINYVDGAKADAKIHALTGALANASVEAQAQYGLERRLTVIDKESVPLAFAPAFIPSRSGNKLGDDKDPQIQYTWTPYDPISFPSQATGLSELANALDKSHLWNDAPK